MRKNSFIKIAIYGIVGLAALGLIIQLLTNASGFLSNLIITAIFALVIFGLLYYFVLGGRNSSSDSKKYKQAVRQSKSKYSQNRGPITSKAQNQPNTLKKTTKKRPSHLRVIDGNKSKRKKRASN